MKRSEYPQITEADLPGLAERIFFQISFVRTSHTFPTVTITYHQAKLTGLLPLLPEKLERMLGQLLFCASELHAALAGIEMHVVNDRQMAILNKHYMGMSGPTNILSFPGGADMPGILALSANTLTRESQVLGQDCADYLFHLLTHGIGHLAGFDHGMEMDGFTQKLKSCYSQGLYKG